jgi:predicted secreted protein
MARHAGRNIIISREATPIAAGRSKTITINSEPIDVTTDDDAGFRTLLEDPATRSVDLSIEGVMEDDVLLALAADDADPFIGTIEITFDSGAVLAGEFRFNSLAITGEHDGAATFTAEMQSTGAFTFTPA